MPWFCCKIAVFFLIQGVFLQTRAALIPENRPPAAVLLSFEQNKPCTYTYQVAVYTARGSKSTASQGYELHTIVDVTPVAHESTNEDDAVLHSIRMEVREPRIRRVSGRRITNHPVNEELEKKLSKPFFFRQYNHGTVVDALFPKNDDPQAVALKKGIAGAFQVHLKSVKSEIPSSVKEHDDSGVYYTKYTTLLSNETDTTVKREWTNHDYLEFADGTPTSGEHKVQFQHAGLVHIRDGQIKNAHRTHKGSVQPTKGHPRAENLKQFQEQEQDIEMSTSGYSKLTLLYCSEQKREGTHHRSRRSAHDPEYSRNSMDGLHRDSLVFRDVGKMKWKDVGGEKLKFRPLYELFRCFTDKTVKNREIGECTRELHKLVKHDEGAFQHIRQLALQRNHQNVTTWAVVISALAAHGKIEAQDTLAQALKSNYARQLTDEEYEALLEGIFYLPKGPLHKRLFAALFQEAARYDNRHEHSAMPMLVLAGLVKRAHIAGYNRTLSDSVAELIHHSYRNKSNVYHPDSSEHESYLRDHIWAYGNLGHLSGLEVLLRHLDHDSSGVRSAVISAMRKLPPQETDNHLLNALYRDERNDVKAAVLDVFIERHQHLTDRVVEGLEHAIWHAEDGDALDLSVKEFLENHGNHPKAVHVRKRRSMIRRQKRALFPFLRPREYKLGPNKRWIKTFGGKWLGAESRIQFLNQVKLRIGIFGGSFEVNLDNYAIIQAHLLKFTFDVVKGKAAFKASASFKNDIPKDLIHTIADAGDDILKSVDGITDVIVTQIEKFKNEIKGYVPLQIDKFVDFVNKIIAFVQNLVKPLRPINLMNKILQFAKNVINRLKNWKWMMDKIKKIQISLGRLTIVDDVFKKVIAALDIILDIVNRISLRLPHNLPRNFRIEDLLKWLESVSVDLQADKIKEYFKSLGFAVPGGFRLQLPFKFAIQFSFSMDKFTSICVRLVHYANNFLDMSSIFDSLRSIRFPHLRLPELDGKFPALSGKGFNFGLSFDWRINLKFNLDLKAPGFLKFVKIFGKLGEFLKQFKLPSFDLEKFFDNIMPGKDLDLVQMFRDLFAQNHNGTTIGRNPAEVLKDFFNRILSLLDLKTPNITAISDITDFFRELGPAVKEFAKESVKKVCNVYKFALNSSRDFKDFGENIETQSITVLKRVENNVQNALGEVMNFTTMVDSMINEIEKNFTVATRGFVANSLQDLSKSLKEIQSLADQVVDFANGTASKVTGVCMKTADFSADVIDSVQNISKEALTELQQFIGPVAVSIKDFGQQLKTSVTKVETWYNENLAVRVGKISKIARLIADFMSVLNTKKGFLGKVKEIALKINDILLHLRNIPDYAAKARKTADDIINFANRAQNFKNEIQKLDVRKKFGIDYDTKVRDLCNEFKAMATETLDKIRGYNIVEEVNEFFTQEADKLITKAVTKFRQIKEPINEVQEDLKEISGMVERVMHVLKNLKPFSSNLSPILATVNRLPDCQTAKQIFLESTKPCVRKASIVGKYVIAQYKDMRKEIVVLLDMIPETWKSFKVQKCIKGGTCISKAFIDQAKAIKEKVDVLKEKFEEASGYTDMLETCKGGVENITAVVNVVKLLIKQIKAFDLRDDVKQIKDVLRNVTGREEVGEGGGGAVSTTEPPVPTLIPTTSASEKSKNKIQRIIDYIKKAKETQTKMKVILENTFKAMRTVYDDAIYQHTQSIQDVRTKLQLSYNLWKKTKDINTVIQALDTIIKGASDYAEKLNGVTTSFSSPVVNLLFETGELSNTIKPHMDKYVGKVTDVTSKINRFLNQVTEFLNKIQLRQKGLDPSTYKDWSEYPYCSVEVCLRSLRRSSSLYLKTIFTWKFPHLDDLSSLKGSGRWLTPGLFDNYKVEGIAQLSDSEMLLGMHGVSANEGKASVLVVTDLGRQTVKKIVQLGSSQSPFTVKISGVAIARDYIWLSDKNSRNIYRIGKSAVGGSSKPSWAGVSRSVRVEGTASSVSYDEPQNMLWVTDGQIGKGFGYRLSANGDLLSGSIAPDRVIVIGKEAQGMAIVRQFSTEYVVVSRCAAFQCKLEFHDLTGTNAVGENSLSRIVRTPSGLESVQRATNDLIVIAFSSATFSERDNIERIGGDFEDRYFRIKLPILKITFGIYENCLMFKVWQDWIIRPRRLFPIGDLRCGALRKRSIEQQLLESDVYSDELEAVHNRNKRDTGEPPSCMTIHRGNAIRGYHEFYSYRQVIIVFVIPVIFEGGAGGHYFVDYQGQLCMRDKTFKVGLIPGAWISAHAGVSAIIFIVQAGITIEAVILETYLLPELTVKIDKWPLKACIELKLRMTPLKIRVWLWYQFLLCIRIRCKCFSCSIRIRWCSKKTFAEWWWSARTIERTLFTTCKKNVDSTPPIAGSCTARQAGDQKYFVQWHGFREDTRITFYRVMIGSIQGSGDDFGANVGTSISHVIRNLPIMHGRDVYVSVKATNAAGLESRLALCPIFTANRRSPEIRYVKDGADIGQDRDYQSDNYALGTNFAWKKGVTNVVDVKWGISDSPKCTLDQAEADIYPLTSMGESLSIQTSGLPLSHGRKYYARVVAMNSFGLKTVMCSNGVVIDTTPPRSGYLYDGAGQKDADFLPSIRRVRAKFQPFTDLESPMIKYEWKIVVAASGMGLTSFVTVPLTQNTPLMEGLRLETGTPYKIVLRGTNAAGLQTVVESNGFKPDSTAPSCVGIIDVTNEEGDKDVDFVSELKTIQAKWSCSDTESGIRDQLVAVGTYPGGQDVQQFRDLNSLVASILPDGNVFARITNIAIKPGVRYHVTVKVKNGAGLRRTLTSDGILIDTTPPTVAPQFVKDGAKGKDQNYTKERFTFSAHWEQAFADAESGLREYRFGVGTKPGLTDTKSFTSVGNKTSGTLTGLLLESGRKYYAVVIGCNGVGMCINGSSNGAIVDFVPPHPGKVTTGYQGPPVRFQWITKSVWARWNWCEADEKDPGHISMGQCSNSSFYDVHSGINTFGISVSSMMNGELLAGIKEVGRVRMSGRTIELGDGIFSAVVQAKDKAGMTSSGLSNTFIVDSSPPAVTHLQHGYSGEVNRFAKNENYTFRGSFEIEDVLSKVAAYKISVGSYSGADDVFGPRTITLPVAQSIVVANWTADESVALENGRKYYITVQAINSAGLFGSRSSEALISDSEPPKNAMVLDGWGMVDAKYQSYTSIYRAHWHGLTDFSGINDVYLGLSSQPKATSCDQHPLERVPDTANYHMLSGLRLQSGSKYYACLKVVDNSQNEAFFSSNGVLVDNSPPFPGKVADGKPGEDLKVQTESSILRAYWANFTEQETEIVQYQLSFGTSPGGTDVQDFTDVGLVTSAASTRLKVYELTNGQRYYATVMAFNSIGLPSYAVSSDGVLVDFTPPSFTTEIQDGTANGVDMKYTSGNSLSCLWACEDRETSLQSVEVAFGLQPGNSDVQNFTHVSVGQTKYSNFAALRSGFRYFATVRCTNKVGLKSVSSSDGVIYDVTPPQGVLADDSDYQNSTRKINLKWKFVDVESGMQQYKVVLYQVGSLSRHGPFSFDGNVTSSSIKLAQSLTVGRKYLVNVTGINGVGLSASLESDGFVVDTTPPICSHVWNGNNELVNALRFVPQTTKLSVSWICYDNESPIRTFRFAVQDTATGKYVLPFHALKAKLNSSGSAIITGNGRWLPEYKEGRSYKIGIELVNAVNLKSVYWTSAVTVDSTPPVFKNLKLRYSPRTDSLTATWNVTDEESGLKSLQWGLGSSPELTDIHNLTSLFMTSSTSLKIPNSQVTLRLGRTYFTSLVAVNNASLSSRAVSNGVVIDRTPPKAGIVIAQYVLPLTYDRNKNVVPGATFTVSWTGFIDQQSGIAKYSWAVGTNLQTLILQDHRSYLEIAAEESVGGVVITNVTVTGNTTYYVCIRATNGAGLQRTDCSKGITVVLGKFSAGIVKDGPSKSRKDSDFQLDDRAIWVHWSGFKDPVFGISSYEWCIGDRQPTPSETNICKWSYMKLDRIVTKAHRFHNLSLAHGKTYYTTVKAKNSRGESVRASSDGVLVDRSPPDDGSIKVAPTAGSETLYMTSLSVPTVTWTMEDRESGISHFQLGVGSFPTQDDLMSFTRIANLERSTDLDDFNFTTSQGLSFYVTVIGFNMLGLETSLTSQQVIVDITAPESGYIFDGNLAGDVDYQTDNQKLSAHWRGFTDPESDVVEYHWCIGKTQGACDVKEMTSVELQTSVSANAELENGVRYYVTVQATNAAGLQQTASSDGLTIDRSPPNVGQIRYNAPSQGSFVVSGKTSMQNTGRTLAVSWDKITDDESDVLTLKWCAGTSRGECNVMTSTEIDVDATSLEYSFERPISTGTSLYVSLEARNGAGLTSNVTSGALLIDKTKPSVGGITVGNTPGMKYLTKDEALKADWGGFNDRESGLDHYELAVCFASSKKTCITSYLNVGLMTSITHDALDLKPGMSYVLVIRGYNKVNLYSEGVSNMFSLVETNPVPGAVFDGSQLAKDIAIQSSVSTMSANWEPFVDRSSRINTYEICVGSAPFVCNVTSFQIVGTDLKGQVTGLNLKHKATYYVTVRATNNAGYSSTSSSNGVKIDSTPPVAVEIRDGLLPDDIDYQSYDSFISANWDEFEDPESGIDRYLWCAGTIKGSCDIIPERVIRDRVAAGLQVSPPVSTGITVYIKLSAVNGAGTVTTVTSDGVKIDGIPPVITQVNDLQTNESVGDIDYLTSKTKYCASWTTADQESGVQKSEISVCSSLNPKECLVDWMDVGRRTLVCMSNLELVEGMTYKTVVRVTNSVGLSSVKASDGFITDSTPPFIGEIEHTENLPDSPEAMPLRFTSSDISVQWRNFWDKESAVGKYYLCVGTRPETCDTKNYTSVENSTAYTFKGLKLKHATMYYVSIIAENKAGLRSTVTSSDGVLMDDTAPLPGSKVYDGNKEGKDIDYQQSNKDIKAHWTQFEDFESDVIKITWCAGTKPGKCDIASATKLSVWMTSVNKVLDTAIPNGQPYYVTVQATNGAGKVTSVTSDGVTVDTSPPIAGVVMDGNSMDDVDYILGDEDVTGHWLRFVDAESGIGMYEVAICDARNLSNCPQQYASVSKATNISVTGLDLETGAMYLIKVKATNLAGLQVEAISDGFTVDFSPPTARTAWEGTKFEDQKYQRDSKRLPVRWLPFSDPESGIVKYEVCVSLPSSECNVTSFMNVGLNTSCIIPGLSLSNGKTYQVTVRGTNGVGQTVKTTTNGVLVDTTPPKPVDPVEVMVANNSTPSPYLRFSCTEELLNVDWDEFEDLESGLSKYEWCVGKKKGVCDVISTSSVGLKTSAQAIIQTITSGTYLYAKVNVVNKVDLKTRLISKQCLVITAAPRVIEVIDLKSINTTNITDIDWKASLKSLTFRWKLLGKFLGDITRMQLEVAVTHPSSNESYPKLDKGKSWNGEPIAQEFMKVPPSHQNVTVRSLDLKPWQLYRGVVRVWNEGHLYAEGSTDGLRLEPRAPFPRRLIVKDNAPEKEQRRWLPNLRLSPVNESLLDRDVIYISSPADLTIAVTIGINNTNSTNEVIDLLAQGLFSPTKEFKVLVTRVTSEKNSTNTTEDTMEMKTLPGIANPEGPCCLNHSLDPQLMYADTHFKPTLPVQKFGSSVAFISNGYAAVGALGKAFVFSTRKRSHKHEVIKMADNGTPRAIVHVAAYEKRVVITANGTIKIFRCTFSKTGSITLQKEAVISNCRVKPCNADITWPNLVGQVTVIINDTIATRGMIPSTNSSVVGIFREANGAWRLDRVLGQIEQDSRFGQSIAVNSLIIVILFGGGRSDSSLNVYSKLDLTLIMKIRLNQFGIKITAPSLRLTDRNALILVSKESRKLLVLQIDVTKMSYQKVCHYNSPPDVLFSGSADITSMNGGTVVAIGMQTIKGRDGALLIGFNGDYQYNPDHLRGDCVALGRIDSRENHFRVDDGIPRADVSIKGTKIMFGTPGVLTLPGHSQQKGMGRVYMATYCPHNFMRIRISGIGILDTYQCRACEESKSFGGYSSICTSCEGRKCASLSDDDPIHFKTDICDKLTCPYNVQYQNNTRGIKIVQENGTFFAEGPVNEFTVKLVETTRADMSTISKAEPFIIDTTSPDIGTVYDGLGSDRNKNCSSNMTFGEDSQCSTRDFQETDIDFTNNTSEVHARWIDFADKESDIVEYFWCIGSKPMIDDIRACESTGKRPNGSHYGFDFQQGDKYYVTVVACNGARRCSATHSNGVTIDTTPPKMFYVRDGVLGPDMDFQVFVDIIFAYFKGDDPDSGVTSYEVAWGSAPGLTNVSGFVEIGDTTTWYAKFKDNGLKKNHKYYATVRATNRAGLLSVPMSSDGIVVGKSEYIFDKNASASFFFDTVNMNVDGTRKDGGVGKTYGTLDVPQGAVDGEVKLRCYSLDKKTLSSNTSDDGPVSDPKITRPKQFMMGNYSFQIKAVSPYNNTPQEGYRFAKPIKVAMFYDVDNLVKSNKRVVNSEVKKEDIDPVLYLWDQVNNTWMDASLTCSEPWYHVNRTIKLLTVNICHLTQFAFFWSFKAQRGLMMFDKNTSVYNKNGEVEIIRQSSSHQIELPIKRSKGAMGDIEVKWSLYNNQSSDTSKLLWPSSGVIKLKESQWNATLTLNVASGEEETEEQVVWVRLDSTTGGAVLASSDLTRSKLVIAPHTTTSYTLWIIIGVCGGVALLLFIGLLIFGLKRKKRRERTGSTSKQGSKFMTRRRGKLLDHLKSGETESIPMDSAAYDSSYLVPSEILSSQTTPQIYRLPLEEDVRDSSSDSSFKEEDIYFKGKTRSSKKKISLKKKPKSRENIKFINPIYETGGSDNDPVVYFNVPHIHIGEKNGVEEAVVHQRDSPDVKSSVTAVPKNAGRIRDPLKTGKKKITGSKRLGTDDFSNDGGNSIVAWAEDDAFLASAGTMNISDKAVRANPAGASVSTTGTGKSPLLTSRLSRKVGVDLQDVNDSEPEL